MSNSEEEQTEHDLAKLKAALDDDSKACNTSTGAPGQQQDDREQQLAKLRARYQAGLLDLDARDIAAKLVKFHLATEPPSQK